MSVLNRKMFNRGARKELRKKGGIEDVQYFQTAGAVNAPNTGVMSLNLPTPIRSPLYNTPSQNVSLGTIVNPKMPNFSMNQLFGQEGSYFKLPTKFDTPGDARIAQIVRTAATKGVGSLSALQMAQLESFAKGLEGREIGTSNIPILNAVKKILEVAKPVLQAGKSGVGLIEGAIKKSVKGDPAQGGIGGYLGSGVPSREVIEAVGGEMIDMPTGLEELEKMQRAQRSKDVNIAPKGTLPTDVLYAGQEGRISGEQDPASQLEKERMTEMYAGQEGRLADRIPGLFAQRPNIDDSILAQSREEIANLLKKQAEGYTVSPPEGDKGDIAFETDPNVMPKGSFEEFSKIQKAPPTEEEKDLIKLRENILKNELQIEDLVGQKLGRGIEEDPVLKEMITKKDGSKEVITDVTAEDKKIDKKKIITEKEDTVAITNPNTNEQELVNDPKQDNVTVDEGGKTISTPVKRPDNWSEIVTKAKENTGVDSEPVTAKNLVKMEDEEDTFSMEDYKAKILKLLPKYSENKAQNNAFYGAMIGFSIAAGASPNAITNIANGFKQVLPLILKDKQKEKEFEKEVDLTAAKFAIEKSNALDTQQNKRTSFFVKEPFTDPFTGEEYKFGHMKIMNEKTYDKYIKAGFGGQFTSESIIEEMIETNGLVEKAKLAKTGAKAINDFYSPATTKEYFGINVTRLIPNAAGFTANRKTLYPNQGEDTQNVVGAYKVQIGDIQKNLETIDVLSGMLVGPDKKPITGVGGMFGKMGDALKAAVNNTPMEDFFRDNYGVDFDSFSSAKEYEVLQRALVLELTPLLLGESAKTISDNDRKMIARAMGFTDAKIVSDGPGGYGGVLEIGTLTAFEDQPSMNKALVTVRKRLLGEANRKNTKFQEFLTDTNQTLGKPEISQQDKSMVGQIIYNIDRENKTLVQS
tara:strand:+ start:746 stop:3505 length:2760 start_codon:yes stop_codon:yes gene_type:complete